MAEVMNNFGLNRVIRRTFIEFDDNKLAHYPARRRISSDYSVEYKWDWVSLLPTSDDTWADLEDSPVSMNSEDCDFDDMLPSRAVIELDEEEMEKDEEKESKGEKSQDSFDTKVGSVPACIMAPPGVWANPLVLPVLARCQSAAPTPAPPQQTQMPPGSWAVKQDSVMEAQAQGTPDALVQYTPIGTPPRRPVLDCPAEGKTTIVIRNFPHSYTRDMVCELLNSQGFDGCYDFVYLPVDFLSWMAFGYAFINMKTHEDALRAMDVMEGFSNWGKSGGKECGVVWSDPYQGLAANIERYRNSPVMGPTVHEIYKPLLFLDGKISPFPAPTKKLNPPRVRRSSQYSQIRASIEVN